MRPADAFQAIQQLRARLRSDAGLDAEDCDSHLALLEAQLVRGQVIDAADVMAIAQQALIEQRNDPALVNPELLPALIAGLSVVTGALPLPAL